MIIEMDGISINVSRKKIKNIYLRIIRQTAEVTVSAPHSISTETIYNFLLQKRHWIHKARAQVTNQVKIKPIIQNGETHYFLGESYSLVIYENAAHMKISISEKKLIFFVKPGCDEKKCSTYLNLWYKHHMQQLLPSLISKWEIIVGVKVHSWTIRSMTSRFGSCNVALKRICLNLILIQKPIDCLEYVLVHELVHLHEANHSKRFYALMDKYLPNWRDLKIKLKNSC